MSMPKPFRNILVVKKQAPYEHYLQLKAQGRAPPALRWERLKNRFDAHKKCFDDVIEVLKKSSANYLVIGREEMHRGSLLDKDLVISVGGDGTLLGSATFLDDSIPILGINSDPSFQDDMKAQKLLDERRSKGALCAITARNVDSALPLLLSGCIAPSPRTRIQCLVRSTHMETILPPALNDLLIAHPTPAEISRFRFTRCRGNVTPSYKTLVSHEEVTSINAWSSGLWISTATGSTAAMHAAGGEVMAEKSTSIQYMVREHLLEEGQENLRPFGRGMFGPSQMLHLRWNSQVGCIYVDGSHLRHQLELGDEVMIDGRAPVLQLFRSPTDDSEKYKNILSKKGGSLNEEIETTE